MNNVNEISAVRKKIELYIEGTKTGDVNKLKQVFYDNAIMSGYLMNNQMICSTPEPFFNDIQGKMASLEYDAQIINIDITNEIASAVLVETGLHGIDFVNYFHLQKIDNEWRIVSKLFTSTICE